MAGLDLSGFNVPEDKFEGLYQAASSLQRRNILNQRLALQEQGRQAATSKFVTDYLDPKDHLTGTAYDPQIVSGLQSVLQQAQGLIQKGAATQDVMMAIGPQVAKLNEYSTKAKLINDQVKASIAKLKGYAGYNPEALETEAKKQAFYGPDGKLKDISSVDPTTDWVTEAAKNNPEAVTTGKGLDDFIAKTPMNENSLNGTTAYGGRSQQNSFDAKFHDWMMPAKDEKGNIATDENGMALPMIVKGSPMLDDKNKPIINPDTGKPFMAMDKGYFTSIMQHNPDVADFVRGQVNKHFRDAGAKDLPVENSPQWDMMARHILGDELQMRDHSSLKIRDTQKETGPAIRVELGQDPNALSALAKYEAASKLKGDYAMYDPKAGKAVKTNAVQTVGEIFNNNPAFLQGPSKDLPDGRTVIDVSDAFPKGGLRSGRGSDDVYKSVYYDPNKRSLIVEYQAKTKDQSGQKPITTEEVPEAKIGLFMSRIAAPNDVDPARVNDIFNQVGYKGAKFTNPNSLPEVGSRVNQEHAQRLADVDKAVNSGDFGSLKGHQTKDGQVESVEERGASTWLGADKYAVFVRDANGKKVKSFTTDDKDKLSAYLKGGQQSQPTKGSSGIQWQK
jgi:hypothetical protein